MRSTEIEMFGQLGKVRHPGLGLGLLPVMAATLIDDFVLLPLLTANGVGISFVVVFADLPVGKPLQSLQP
jgi:hypothetical protein